MLAPEGHLFFTFASASATADVVIATLGPAGTSSEQAAHYFAAIRGGEASGVHLAASYEQALEHALEDSSVMVVVANAYSNINVFYMHPRLLIDTVFFCHTPKYGLAARGDLADGGYSVASHPDPVPLIDELSPAGFKCDEVIYMASTSGAADFVASKKGEVALTTEIAAARRGLKFISSTRPIPMVWTVFRRA
ncbi:MULTISPECIES: hypothetical protein [unclassified Frankia]|uniref:hypothetical protein n=1 Tax=unclassified Frankia TaxID=2632575 RepID=UPI001EF3F218|nr:MULTISPECIES: hypothetical protein [unclassified Frankia]